MKRNLGEREEGKRRGREEEESEEEEEEESEEGISPDQTLPLGETTLGFIDLPLHLMRKIRILDIGF